MGAGGLALPLHAEVLSPAQAYMAATAQAEVTSVSSRKAAPISTTPILTLKADGQPTVYLFGDANGCLVASAESETPALLGYMDSPLATSDEIPDAMRYWLDYYSHEIKQLRSGNVIRRVVPTSEDYAPVSPILKTLWNQGSPYNNLCPMLGSNRSVTGCVATGMAQAMKAHNWPVRGQGEISYKWTNGGETLSCDFSESVYDWDNMLDSYSGPASRVERDAVATLMRDCGYSVRMNYSPSASGASAYSIALAFYTYFDYDRSMRLEIRDNFYTDEWTDLVYTDVAAGRPVVYCGSGAAGGHCFVADGYSSDGYFHFNWGWGGVSDGYFRLSALAPGIQGIGGNDDNFNSNQSIVYCLRKPVEGSKLGVVLEGESALVPKNMTNAPGSTIRFGNFEIVNLSVEEVSGTFGLKLIPDEGEPVYVAGTTSSTMGTLYDNNNSATGFRVPVDNFPSSGSYAVRPAFQIDEEWYDVEMSTTLPESLRCKIEEGTVTFEEADPAAMLDVTDLKITSKLYAGKPFSVSFDASNPGTKDYYGDMVFVLYKEDTGVTNTSYFTVDVPAGGETTVDFVTQFLSTARAGDYTLYLINRFGNVYAYDDITIEDAPDEETKVELTDLEVSNATSVSSTGVYTVNPDYIKVEGKITCTQGYLTDSVYAYLYPITGGYAVANMGNSSHLLSSGESADVTFEGTYPSAENDTEYMIAFFFQGSQLPNILVIKADKNSSVTSVQGEEMNVKLVGDMLFLEGVEQGAYTQIFTAEGASAMEATGNAIDVSGLKAGVYIVVAVSGEKVQTAKIIR